MKAEDSTQKKILDEISATLREGGKTYELIPKIREALSKDPCHQSQIQALKEEVQSLHNDLSHVDESNWNEAVIDALGRLRKMKNLITNLEDK